MSRLILLLSCAVTGLLAACPAGYRPMTPTMCYKTIKTATSSRIDVVVICPDGYTKTENPKMCFKLSDFADARSYQSAVDACRKTRGRLIDLDTPEKYGLIAGYMTALGPKGGDAQRNTAYRVWTGLKRSSKTGFKWNTGSTKVPAWGKGEPDNSRGEDCGQLDSWGLSDLYCHLRRRYICEIPL
ncbi:C-type lectin domain family 4 member M-like [Haliotis rufescens]|uniref:C-type lectin domain family 4 member M-like n=1 Tax=Haliotis rufescens TaxID=6454 RepID=UPI00201F9F8E|nr:C-type lectin domain family 4 member M-like [Haliotis rufescens]